MKMNQNPLYIFDVDGTIALIKHRRHFLERECKNKWHDFYAACDKDLPNDPVIRTMKMLRMTGAEIWFFSGRGSEVRDKTISWLADNTSFMSYELDEILVMRDEGDYTEDDRLKKSWYDNMLVEGRERLVAVFDDRDRVVKMWRDSGVTCFQEAEGEF